MGGGISYSGYIFGRVSNIMDELEVRGVESVILSDLAVSLYGIIKPISEVRLLVENKDPDTVAYAVSKELGMGIYQKDILNSLKTIGKAVLNPVFIPLTIIEVAKTSLDKELLVNRIIFAHGEFRLKVPRIEYLVAKLLEYNSYPYNIYAYTLIIVHEKIIDFRIFNKLLKDINIDPERIKDKISKIASITSLFPELGMDSV